MINIFSLTFKELSATLSRLHEKGDFHAAAIYRQVFKNGNTEFGELEEFKDSPELAANLMKEIRILYGNIIDINNDRALKFVTSLFDGNIIESVIIPSDKRTTLCVSSQVGCRWKCAFCATGALGLVRNLSVEEIVGQVFSARFTLKRSINNIVFMGMGEPFDNFDNVIQSIRVISDQHGFNIAPSHITVSTSGHADGIARLRFPDLKNLRLAVSVNAPVDNLRSRLMPINRLFPLGRLKEELKLYPLGKRGVFFIEYVLFSGINDTREMAEALAVYLKGLPVRVNIIPCNTIESLPFTPPSTEHVKLFCSWLAAKKLFVRIRQPNGREIMAACGQLCASLLRK
jgi:23S rRNA (adenine2503-C2)-methyltransferase